MTVYVTLLARLKCNSHELQGIYTNIQGAEWRLHHLNAEISLTCAFYSQVKVFLFESNIFSH